MAKGRRGRPRKDKGTEPQESESMPIEESQPEEKVEAAPEPKPAPTKPKPKNEPVMMLEQFLKQARLNSPALKRFMKKHYGYASKPQSQWQGIADGIRNRKVQ